VNSSTLLKAQTYIKSKPYLVWGSKDYTNLSQQSIVENILNYGDWNDFQYLKSIFDIKDLSKIFKELSNKKRTNLRPQTLNYFTNYFSKYA